MKVFVTGANGFLGSHLVDRLLERSDEVHVLIRKTSNLRWLIGKKVHFHYGDVTDESDTLVRFVNGMDIVYHVAGVIRAPRREVYHRINAMGTAHVLEACLQNPSLKRCVIVTSIAAHGPGVGLEPSRESDPAKPVTEYGKSKRDAELIAFRYRDRLPITIIRPPAIYGPRDDQVLQFFRMLKWGFALLPAGGRQVLNLASVHDVVKGLLLAAESPQAVGEIFFIGEDHNYDWSTAADVMGRAFRRRPVKITVPIPVVFGVAGVSHLAGILMNRLGKMSLNLDYARNFVQKNWGLNLTKAHDLLGYRSDDSLEKGSEATAA